VCVRVREPYFFLIHRSHSISFTRAQGIPKYKIGFGREKDGRVGRDWLGGGGHGARDGGWGGTTKLGRYVGHWSVQRLGVGGSEGRQGGGGKKGEGGRGGGLWGLHMHHELGSVPGAVLTPYPCLLPRPDHCARAARQALHTSTTLFGHSMQSSILVKCMDEVMERAALGFDDDAFDRALSLGQELHEGFQLDALDDDADGEDLGECSEMPLAWFSCVHPNLMHLGDARGPHGQLATC
jgi:hypothetical protein